MNEPNEMNEMNEPSEPNPADEPDGHPFLPLRVQRGSHLVYGLVEMMGTWKPAVETAKEQA